MNMTDKHDLLKKVEFELKRYSRHNNPRLITIQETVNRFEATFDCGQWDEEITVMMRGASFRKKWLNLRLQKPTDPTKATILELQAKREFLIRSIENDTKQ